MPFEETVPTPAHPPDRKLGDEWLDWDGTREPNDTRTPQSVFIILAGVVIVGLILLGWLIYWLSAPRLAALGWQSAGWWLVVAGTIYFSLWYCLLLLSVMGIKAFQPWIAHLGGIRWLMGPTIYLGKILGISRDRVGHAFIRVYNQMEVLPPLIKQAAKLLVLLPRCLNQQGMQALRHLRDQYGFSQVIAAGGTEARKAIALQRPQAIMAVACERDILVGLKDLNGRIPVLAFPVRRPEGPCRNTEINFQEIEQALCRFLGKSIQDKKAIKPNEHQPGS